MGTDSDFEKKYQLAIEELGRSSIRPRNYLPPIHKLMRKRGARIRPPHYNTFADNALQMGVFFGIGWGLLMWFITWSSQGMPIWGALISSIAAGGLFGPFMALYYRYSAKRHSLSTWEKLGE